MEHPTKRAPGPAADRTSAARHDRLRDALMDSRQRWRDLAMIAADIAFETDREGRFVFVSPDPALGWQRAQLIGQPAAMLLVAADLGPVFNPFRPPAMLRRRIGWLQHADGRVVCLSFAVAPLLGPDGEHIGARGLGIDTTEQNRYDTAMATALRRAEMLDHILLRMQREVLAPRMMQAALEALQHGVGAAGVAVVDPGLRLRAAGLAHRVGGDPLPVLATALDLLEGDTDGSVAVTTTGSGHAVMAFPDTNRFGERSSLVLWRNPGGRAWDADEQTIAASATGVIRMILEHVALQREMALQARTDPLTGLLNRRAFFEDVHRRIDRLDRDQLPGTVLFIDLDHFKLLNDRAGHEAGDEALRVAAAVLGKALRPTDLIARFGGDEFAAWLDGADDLAAAERAELLRVAAPAEFARLGAAWGIQLTMSIGIACRWPGASDDIDDVLRRADAAMYEAKRAGRGQWRVGPADSEHGPRAGRPPGDGTGR
jgi:diguanylate cyclase (GGDEF)-like protein/PAS domain S-box-containing protein